MAYSQFQSCHAGRVQRYDVFAKHTSKWSSDDDDLEVNQDASLPFWSWKVALSVPAMTTSSWWRCVDCSVGHEIAMFISNDLCVVVSKNAIESVIF